MKPYSFPGAFLFLMIHAWCIVSAHEPEANHYCHAGYLREQNQADRARSDIKIDFKLSGGIGFLTESADKAMQSLEYQGLSKELAEDYYRQLRIGSQFGSYLMVRFAKGVSTGIHYRFFTTQAAVDGTFDPEDGIHLYHGRISEKILVNYAGPSFLVYDLFRSRGILVHAGLSAGPAFYRNETTLILSPFLIKGTSMAIDPVLAFELPLNRFLTLGMEADWLISGLRKITVDDGVDVHHYDLDQEESLKISRINISFLLVWTL